MIKSLALTALSEKEIQAVVNTFNLNAFSFPTVAPLRFSPFLTWKNIQADTGVPIMADVVSYDATSPKKARQIVTKIQGEIPKVDIARVKTESEINEFNQMVAYANQSPDAALLKQIVDWVYEDLEFCWNGINARIEWMLWEQLTRGVLSLSATNNDGINLEYAIDLQIPSAQKKGYSAAAWSNVSNGKPITDIKAIVKLAKKSGYRLGYMIMNQDTFDVFQLSQEVIDYCASYFAKSVDLATPPDLQTANRVMQANGLPTIVIVDEFLTVEIKGARTTVDAFRDDIVTFVPDMNLGATFWGPQAANTIQTSALKLNRNHVVMLKYGTEDPISEITKAMSNVFPVWTSAQRSYLLDTENNSFSSGV